MISLLSTPERLLALDPCHRGVGFVVLDPGSRLVDWGVYRVSNNSHEAAAAVVCTLIERYRPRNIVVECMESSTTRRGARAKALIRAVVKASGISGIPVSRYTIPQVYAVFARWKVRKKAARAMLLSAEFPALRMYRPPHRRPWMSEDPRMAIFDALSFAVTHLVIVAEQEEAKAHIPF